MRGLLLKDLFTIKKEIKMFAIVMILYTVMGLVTKNFGIVTIMGVLAVMTGTLASITYDEKAEWDKFAIGIKFKHSEIVFSKYLLCIISEIIVIVFSFVLLKILGASLEEIVQIITLIMVGSAFVCSFLIPLILKFGPERARLMLVVVILVPSILLVKAEEFISSSIELANIVQFINNNMLALGMVVEVILLSISFFIALAIYKKREF